MKDIRDVNLQTNQKLSRDEVESMSLVDSNNYTNGTPNIDIDYSTIGRQNMSDEDPLDSLAKYSNVNGENGSQRRLRWYESPLFSWIEGDDHSSVAGQVMDAAAKGIMILSRGFLGPAIIYLATEKALLVYCNENDIMSCSIDDIEQTSSGIREQLQLYGMKPSSLLTISKSIALAISAILLPFVGGFIDRTGHLRLTGMTASCMIACINFSMVFLSLKWLEFAWISTILTDVLFQIHNMIILTYLQQLTPTASRLSSYAANFAVIQYTFMTIYTFTMMIYTLSSHSDVLKTSTFAHSVSGSLGIALMGYAWFFLFKNQQASIHHHKKEKNRIGITGDTTWIEKLSRIRRNFPALHWLIITLLFSPNTGSGSYFSVFSTVQVTLLKMNSAQIATCSLVGLLSTFVGTRLSSYVCKKFDPLISFRCSIMVFLLAILGTVIFVSGPQQIPLYYVFAAIEGVSLGWIVPTEKVLLCSLTFLDESETLGLILCIHTLAAWLPPFLFTAINELGLGIRLSLSSAVFLLASAILASFAIGSYDDAAKQVRCQVRLNAK